MAQVAASAFGVPLERVKVISGDTDNTPYGGGTWASRAAGNPPQDVGEQHSGHLRHSRLRTAAIEAGSRQVRSTADSGRNLPECPV